MEEEIKAEDKKTEASKPVNTKTVPIIITLAAAFISCIISIFQQVEFGIFVKRLSITVAIFLVMGTFIKMLLDYSFRTLEPTIPIDADVPDLSSEEGLEEDDESSQDITLQSENEE